MSGELSWDSLFPQFETKQTTVADFHKMAEKRFAKVNENEKDRIVNLAIAKTHKKRHSLG